jgi:hypothetical protein
MSWTLVLLLGLPFCAQEDKEPPLIFSLESGGKKLPIEQDKPFTLDTVAGKTTCVLRVEPFRQFSYGGVSFRYPRDFGFEADFEQEGVKLWTLDGNDCVLMIQRYLDENDTDQVLKNFISGLTAVYPKDGMKESACSIDLEGKAVKGTKINVTLAGQKLTQSCYPLKSGKDTVILVVQDSIKDDGTSSDDARKAEKLLRETFKLTAK